MQDTKQSETKHAAARILPNPAQRSLVGNVTVAALALLFGIFSPARSLASVEYDTPIPQLAFAAEGLDAARKVARKEDLEITITISIVRNLTKKMFTSIKRLCQKSPEIRNRVSRAPQTLSCSVRMRMER